MNTRDWKTEVVKLKHHAYGISGNGERIYASLVTLFETNLGVSLAGNPDVWYKTTLTFVIDDARELSARLARKSVSGQKKFFIVQCRAMTAEAQNALLKLLEEPAGDSHIFILTSSHEFLLSTVCSRLMMFQDESQWQIGAAHTGAQVFVQSSHADRMVIIKKLSEDITAEKKTKYDALELLRGIEMIVAKDHTAVRKYFAALQSILTASTNLNLSGSSVKMNLEQVAFVLPKIVKEVATR